MWSHRSSLKVNMKFISFFFPLHRKRQISPKRLDFRRSHSSVLEGGIFICWMIGFQINTRYIFYIDFVCNLILKTLAIWHNQRLEVDRALDRPKDKHAELHGHPHQWHVWKLKWNRKRRCAAQMKKEQVESNIYVWPQTQIASNLIKAINRSALPKEMEAFLHTWWGEEKYL